MTIELNSVAALKAFLAEQMKVIGVSQADLAGRMGRDARQVRRMLDPEHKGRIEDIETALALLGWQVNFAVEKVA